MHRVLILGNWRHGQYKIFTVCDPKPRIIHKASVADRLIHHAIVRIIEPIFDNVFIYDSWSCRAGKGTHGAVNRLNIQLKKISSRTHKPIWVLKCDIKKYFASVDRTILLNLIEKKIKDTKTQTIIADIIFGFKQGIPLGNLTSQLFANIYLNPFDHFVHENIRPFAYLRYCDDFILVHTDKKWLENHIKFLEKFLSYNLHLTLHPNKIKLRAWHWGIDWLGYTLYPDHIRMRPRTRKRSLRHVQEEIEGYLNREVSYEKFRSVLSSYSGVVKMSDERNLNDFLSSLRGSV